MNLPPSALMVTPPALLSASGAATPASPGDAGAAGPDLPWLQILAQSDALLQRASSETKTRDIAPSARETAATAVAASDPISLLLDSALLLPSRAAAGETGTKTAATPGPAIEEESSKSGEEKSGLEQLLTLLPPAPPAARPAPEVAAPAPEQGTPLAALAPRTPLRSVTPAPNAPDPSTASPSGPRTDPSPRSDAGVASAPPPTSFDASTLALPLAPGQGDSNGAAPGAPADTVASIPLPPPAARAETMRSGAAASAADAAAAAAAQAASSAADSPVAAEARALADAIAAKLGWQAGSGVARAEIRLSPPELGRIDIDLRMDGKQLQVDFSSAHAHVREAIEASVPRLREQLAAQGLTLTQADVNGHARGGGSQADAPRGGETGPNRDDADAAEATAVEPRLAPRRIGLLDEYA